MAFFDVRVFNPTVKRYVNQEISKTYEVNEREKKKLYNERILQIEHRSFTPLIMSARGGMGRECKKFYARLTEATKTEPVIVLSRRGFEGKSRFR